MTTEFKQPLTAEDVRQMLRDNDPGRPTEFSRAVERTCGDLRMIAIPYPREGVWSLTLSDGLKAYKPRNFERLADAIDAATAFFMGRSAEKRSGSIACADGIAADVLSELPEDVRQQVRHQVVALLSGKGGSTKTSCAAELASYWSHFGTVGVIDLDPPQHHLSKWVSAMQAKGIAQADRITVETAPRDFLATLADFCSRFDRVIVDVIGADSDALTIAAANADVTIIPTPDGPLEVEGAMKTCRRIATIEQELAKRGINKVINYRVLLSRVSPRTVLYKHLKQQLLDADVPLMEQEIQSRQAIREGFALGTTASISQPRSAAAREIAAVAAEIDTL